MVENERDLLLYEKKDLEKKLADQKAESELLNGHIRVCSNVLFVVVCNTSNYVTTCYFKVQLECHVCCMYAEFLLCLLHSDLKG